VVGAKWAEPSKEKGRVEGERIFLKPPPPPKKRKQKKLLVNNLGTP